MIFSSKVHTHLSHNLTFHLLFSNIEIIKMDTTSENHACGMMFSIRMGRDIDDLQYFCDHEILDGNYGVVSPGDFLNPGGNFFSENAICDMIELLDATEDSSDYRLYTSKNDSNRFLESIVMDFVYTFGRESIPGDVAIATMKSSTFDLVHSEEEYDEESWE